MSNPSRTPRSPVQPSGRIVGHFDVSRVVAWGQPDLDLGSFTTTNTVVYVWKGLAPSFNLFLVICNANPDRAEPDMITIDLQEHALYSVFRTGAFVGYDVYLSAGLCLIFPDQAQGESFEMAMRGVFLEAAAQRGEVPFRALVTFLLNPMGIRSGRAGSM